MVASGTFPPVVQALTVHWAGRPRSLLAWERTTSTQRLTCVVCPAALAAVRELVPDAVSVGVGVGVGLGGSVGVGVAVRVRVGVLDGVPVPVGAAVSDGLAAVELGVALGLAWLAAADGLAAPMRLRVLPAVALVVTVGDGLFEGVGSGAEEVFVGVGDGLDVFGVGEAVGLGVVLVGVGVGVACVGVGVGDGLGGGAGSRSGSHDLLFPALAAPAADVTA